MTGISVVATIFFLLTIPLWTSCGIIMLSSRTENNLENQVRFHLVYGLLVLVLARSSSRSQLKMLILNRVTLFHKQLGPPSSKKTAKMQKEKKKKRKSQPIWRRIERIDWRELLPVLKKLVKEVRNPQLSGHMEIGSGNPMHVGIISGFYAALSGMVPRLLRNFDLTPVFFRNVSLWQVQFSAQVIPARVAWQGLSIWRAFNSRH